MLVLIWWLQKDNLFPANYIHLFFYSTIPQSTIGVTPSAGFSVAPLQPNILDHPFLAMSCPLQQGHCLRGSELAPAALGWVDQLRSDEFLKIL